MRNRVKSMLAIGGLIVASGAIGGAAVAVAAPTSVSACTARSGSVRVLGTSVRCRRGERKLTWGIRGPRGGYELARERRRITADEILRAAGTIEDSSADGVGSALIQDVVMPAIGQAERAFAAALNRISLDELVRKAEPLLHAAG